MLYPLQRLVMPHLGFNAPIEMYARFHNHQSTPLLNDREIIFGRGGEVSFDTFFNAVTVHSWKKHCEIGRLFLRLQGEGEFIVRFSLHQAGCGHRHLEEKRITLSDNQTGAITIPSWENLGQGLLYFSLIALSDAVLTGGGYFTDAPPINSVQLGVVITHFKREQYVIPAVRRIREELLVDSELSDTVGLAVVDNSRTLTPTDVAGAHLIPNRNLGGSGGFMRGLLHFKDAGYSHCLFMDDDASCEIESIRRMYRLFQYAKTPRMAIAGSLLRDVEPYRLFEKGAVFNGICHPLKSGLDMRSPFDLVAAEVHDQHPDYGAWWLFGFSLSDVTHYSYPFFVRGDDILFGLMNRFDIVTMNGIASWGEDFALKRSPLTSYLDARNHLFQSLVQLDKGRIASLRLMATFSLHGLLSYNYATAAAINLAIEHVLEGPKFWRENIDMSSVREQINALQPSEKLEAIDRADYELDYPVLKKELLRSLLRWVTLNGFLLPGVLLRDRVLFQPKGFRGVLRQIFRYRKVLYEYEPLGIGYIAEHDKRRFFKTLMAFTRVALRLMISFDRVRTEYRKEMPRMTSEAFWREMCGDSRITEVESVGLRLEAKSDEKTNDECSQREKLLGVG